MVRGGGGGGRLSRTIYGVTAASTFVLGSFSACVRLHLKSLFSCYGEERPCIRMRRKLGTKLQTGSDTVTFGWLTSSLTARLCAFVHCFTEWCTI